MSARLPAVVQRTRSHLRALNMATQFQQIRLKSTIRRRKSTFANVGAGEKRQLPPLFRESFLRDVMLKPRTVPVPRWISPRHYTANLSEVFGHSSFILVAISYAVDDFLHLRIIAVAGSSVMLFFTYFHPHGRVLWLPFKWNVLFILINSYRIGKVFLDRYLAEQLSPQMIQLRNDHFYIMDPPDFARLVRCGNLETFKAGDILVSQGEMNSRVRLVLDGELEVHRDNQATYKLQEGNFVSECGLHAGLLLPGKVESCCSIIATRESHCLCWERNDLMDLLHREKGLRRAIKAALSWDIVRKLKSQRQLLASGVIDDPELWTLKRNEQNDHRYAAILHNMLEHPRYMAKRREELNKYRMIHHIDDERHEKALKSFGWTLEEFQAGTKEGQEVFDEDIEERHGIKWFVREFYFRVFG